jgi:hypothetical protein
VWLSTSGHPDYRLIAAGCQAPVLNIESIVSEAAAASCPTICQMAFANPYFALKTGVFDESNMT